MGLPFLFMVHDAQPNQFFNTGDIDNTMTSTSFPIQDYALLDDEECDARIISAKAKLGSRCVILGHHYQRDEVFKHADFTGDSLKLSRDAAQSEAEYIVFLSLIHI